MHKPSVVHSLFDGDSLKRSVGTEYSLDVGSIELLHHGMNDSYIVDAGAEKYILRIVRYGWRSDAEVSQEIGILDSLAKSGIKVSVAKPTKHNKKWFSIDAPEGMRVASLFQCAPGNLPKSIDEDLCINMGRSLAKLHQSFDQVGNDTNRPKLLLDDLYRKPISQIMAKFPQEKGKLAAIDNKLSAIAANIEKATSNGGQIGLIHGDFIPVNFFVDNDDIHIFDFDLCGLGYRAYDLATLKKSLGAYSGNPDDLWATVKREYELSGGEKFESDLIENLGVMRELWVWAWNVEHGEDFRRLNPHSVNHHLQLIDSLASNRLNS